MGRTLYCGFDRATLKELLIICTQESHFLFQGNYYDQVDGVAMGSPLGPLFANIFMDHFESTHIEKLKELGVIDWMRFVDDVFSTLKDESCKDAILKYLNEQHPNIEFTTESEVKQQLPFLDTKVTRTENGYRTKIYHKATYTGVHLNWNSLTSKKYKLKNIHTFCDRIWRICQTKEDREFEFQKLRSILIKNEYPDEVVETRISKFRENREKREQDQQVQQAQQEEAPAPPVVPQTQTASPIATRTRSQLDRTASVIPLEQPPSNVQPDQNAPAQQQPEKRIKYLVLPYICHKAEDTVKRINKLVSSYFNTVEVRVAFTTPHSLGQLFPFKDKITEKRLHSQVIYSIKCKTCNQEYIGKTERILAHRMREHNDPKRDSAIQHHKLQNPDHDIDSEYAEIIDSASFNQKLIFKEQKHIEKRKPELNVQHAAYYKNLNNKEKPGEGFGKNTIFGTSSK